MILRSRPIRVLHVIDGLSGGGCERWLWDIVRFSPQTFEHHVLTTHPDLGNFVYADDLRARGVYHQSAGWRGFNFLSRNSQNSADGVRFSLLRPLSTLMWRISSYALTARQLLKLLIRFRFDVIHTHTFYPSFVTGLMMKAILGKPLIHTSGTNFSQMTGSLKWMPWMYARFHSFVDLFFSGPSDDLIGLGVAPSKIVFNRAGVDVEAIGALRDARDRYRTDIRQSLGLPANALLALSVGRLHSSKGHLFALDALTSLLPEFPNLHWVVLGVGPQRFELEERARHLGVAAHTHLVGYQADPLPYYAAADIYLRTPVFEATNLSSQLAMAMGLATVAFNTGYEDDLMNTVGNGLLVPNQDSDALAQAVRQLLNLPDRGRAIGARGAEYARQHLDVRAITGAFYSAYETLGKRGGRSKPPGTDLAISSVLRRS